MKKRVVTLIDKKQKKQQRERESREGAIRKRRTQEEIATKPQIAEGKDTKEKRNKEI